MNAPTAAKPYSEHVPELAFTRVYIWHWPVRFFHWAMAGSLVVLAVTGLYVGQPYFVLAPTVTTPYLMAWMRFFHFVAGGVLVGAAILRLYALVMGNRYEFRCGRPREFAAIGVQPQSLDVGLALSPLVDAALDLAVDRVVRLLKAWGHRIRARHPAARAHGIPFSAGARHSSP